MADAVTSQTIFDGSKRCVMAFTNLSDGVGEAAVKKVDVSALSPAASQVTILRVWFNTSGMAVAILEDATTDVKLLELGQNTTGMWDFTAFGGIPITKASGYTGDLMFTTTGHTNGDSYVIILEMEKTLA